MTRKANLLLFGCFFAFLFGANLQLSAQNISYQALQTTSTFNAKTTNVNLPVGSIAASADVGGTGAASYTIPIALPPGTNGAVPQLALTYSSQSGDGILGRGWSLSGLSAISRTPNTIYLDNSPKAIEMNNTDRFALDGMRLFDKSGTYGSNNTTYATEVESFSTITSYGNLGGAPEWFKVVTKDGMTMEYGHTTDSRWVKVNVAQPLAWRLNRISYTNGNYIDFVYSSSLYTDSQIQQIKYTGNSNTGLQPYNYITFSYKTRDDINTVYPAKNIGVQSSSLLDNIAISANGQTFKTYSLKYGKDINSFLAELIEAGADNSVLNSTIFKYGDKPTNLSSDTYSAIAGQQIDIFSGDFNGDGLSDLLTGTRVFVDNQLFHSELKVYAKSSTNSALNQIYSKDISGTTYRYRINQGYNYNHSFYTSDFTGNGSDDILIAKIKPNGSNEPELFELRYLYDYNGATFSEATIPLSSSMGRNLPKDKNFLYPGDFNGDGITDVVLVVKTNNAWTPYIAFGGNLSAGFQILQWHSYNGLVNPMSIMVSADYINVIDFNGDGKSDLSITKDSYTEVVNLDGVTVKPLSYSGFPTKWHIVFQGDFNGDGKTDLLSRSSTDTYAQWSKNIGTGSGYVGTPFYFQERPQINQYYYGSNGHQLVMSDFNGDGKMDIGHTWNNASSTSNVDMYYSKGDAFQQERYTHSYSFAFGNAPIVDFNGDGRTEFFNRNHYTDPFRSVVIKGKGKELFLDKVKNGAGHETKFTYKALTEGSAIYTRGSLTPQPLNTVQLPMYVVSDMKSSAGTSIGEEFQTSFTYEGAKLHKEGKGFLGFSKVTRTDNTQGLKNITSYNFNTTYYTPYLDKSSTYLLANNSLLTEVSSITEFVFMGSKRYWAKTTYNKENHLFKGYFNETNSVYDVNGNITQTINSVKRQSSPSIALESTTSSYVYGQYGTPVPAKLTQATVTTTRSGEAPYTVQTKYEYNSLGQLTGQIDFCCNNPKSVYTKHEYFADGNLMKNTIYPGSSSANAGAMGIRETSMVYDPKGRFPISMTNTLGQVSSASYDDRWGTPLTKTGVDGLTISYQYDAFGRTINTTMPTGYAITESYGWDFNTTDRTVEYHLISHPGRPDVKTWMDLLGRVTKVQSEGFGGNWVTEKTVYDYIGRTYSSTAPYMAGETTLVTSNTYDAYNRILTSTNTLGTTNYAYSYTSGDLITTVTNPAGQASSSKVDPSGKTISATDYGGTLDYIYNSQGNLKEVKKGSVILVSNKYDTYGRQTELTDLNAGTTQYEYDALGQLTKQINANGVQQTMTYNNLGQIVTSVGPEGTTTYSYYTSGNGKINKLYYVSGFSGENEHYSYDGYGRPTQKIEWIDGTAFITKYTNNTYGDVTNTTYPSNFAVNAEYDVNGYLQKLKNTDNSTTLYENLGENGFGQTTSYKLGNGKTSNTTYYFGTPTNYTTAGIQNLTMGWNYQNGNLNSRNDGIKSKSESFIYDNLNRLTQATVAGQSTNYTNYASDGNITSKTDVGAYSYSPAKINAVTSVTNTANNINALSQDITYTSFFQPNTVTEGDYEIQFTYGADYERRKTVTKFQNQIANTRFYLGSYERDISGSSTKHIHYIGAGPGLVAMVVRENNVDNYYYTYTDHLGSIVSVTNNTGVIIAEQNFDAWGRNRNPNTWTYTNVPTVPNWLYRGYTGHEHLASVGLINMNGRMYDPILGRMLSVDNYVQAGGFTQSYNRYTYAWNNPLKYNDPNGEFVFAAMLVGIAATAIQASQGKIGGPLDFFGTFALNAGAAYAGSAVTTGLASPGAYSSFAAAGAGGLTSGFISTTGNDLMNGASLSSSLKHGIKSGVVAGVTAGTIGGVLGGIKAVSDHRNFFTGVANNYELEPYLVADASGVGHQKYHIPPDDKIHSTISNHDTKAAYFRSESGATSTKNIIKPGHYVRSDKVDGFVTSYSIKSQQVYKASDAHYQMVITKGGGVSSGWGTFERALDRYGWITKSYAIDNGFYHTIPEAGAQGIGWDQLWQLIPLIK